MTPRTLMCFGDSNTHGSIALSARGAVGRFDRTTRWPGVLAGLLGDSWHVIEEGHGGRTTVHDDPIEGAHRNGASVLLSLLETHRPLDLVILMLGTNDLKPRFSVTPADITLSVEKLVGMIRTANWGIGTPPPQILVVAPVPITETGCLAEIFEGGRAKSLELAARYEAMARDTGCLFFDAGAVAATDPVDGVHLTADAHHAIATGLAPIIKREFP